VSPIKIKASPCSSCPYRTDVPPGVWAPEEYEKLLAFDRETGSQPRAVFLCHSDPEKACSGWVTCHEARPGRELLALRLRYSKEIPEHGVPIFSSAKIAALHGLSGVEQPPAEAFAAMEKVARLRATREP
jgi:hypothetical protein